MNVLALGADVAATLLTAGAVMGCLYLLYAASAVRAFPMNDLVERPDRPAVTILKPLHGAESGLRDRLLSFCDQRYDGAVQIVFGCQSTTDPAVAVAREVAQLRPGLAVEMVVDARQHGGNRKVSNLIHCLARAEHDLIVLADSDIAVDSNYLERIVGALEPADVGAVTCLYVGEGAARGAGLSALAIDSHFLPNVLAGMALGAARPCFGSTIALRRDTLAGIGGFEAVADKLADDYAIGAAVRGLGLRVAVPGFVVHHVCDEPTFSRFFAHQLRVARTIRRIDPLGHAGAIVTNPLPLAILAACLWPTASWLVAASILARQLLVGVVNRRFGAAPRAAWRMPLCDLAIFAVHLASFCGSGVEWRGHRLRSRADGTLAPCKEPNPA